MCLILGERTIYNHLQIGKGKDIIFLHGWGGNLNSFSSVANALSKNYRCTLIDFYGFGETKHPNHPLSLNDYANEVEQIIRYYNMEDVILVGHSFGGRVAILIASYSTRISGILLCDSAGIKPHRTIKYYYKVAKYKLAKSMNMHVQNTGSSDYNELSGAMRATFVKVVNFNLKPILNKITVPTLIVWGELDQETPLYMAHTLHKYISGSKLNILEGAGHYSYLDCYNQFVGLLKEFLIDYC